MEQKLILLLFFSLMITPTILASCAPSQLYCDSSYQDILKCDEEGNQKFVYQECSKGCQLTLEGPICKEHLVKSRIVSSFILPVGIILLILGTVLIIYFKVLKSKRKIKS